MGEFAVWVAERDDRFLTESQRRILRELIDSMRLVTVINQILDHPEATKLLNVARKIAEAADGESDATSNREKRQNAEREHPGDGSGGVSCAAGGSGGLPPAA